MKLCGGDPKLTGKLCFANIYRRPEDVWAKAAPCFDKNYDDAFSPCLEYGKCRNEATGELLGQPWLGKSLTK